MKGFYITILLLLMGLGISAATHSAWSSSLCWDAIGSTACQVGIENHTLAPLPAGISGFSIIPNPASSSKSISFLVKGNLSGKAELKVFDLNGKVVKTFTVSSMRTTATLSWNPSDKNGKSLPSGMYLARLKAGATSFEQKFMLLK